MPLAVRERSLTADSRREQPWRGDRFGPEFVGQGPVVVGGGQGEGFLVMLWAVVKLPRAGQGDAEVECAWRFRARFSRPPVMGNGLVDPSAAGQGDAEVVVGLARSRA